MGTRKNTITWPGLEPRPSDLESSVLRLAKVFSSPDFCCHCQVIMGMLRKKNSIGDWGTFASNAIITGNRCTGENYDKIRDFPRQKQMHLSAQQP